MAPRIEYTDDRFVVARKAYPRVPLLVDSANRFVAPVCDYLREQVLNGQIRTSSARTYAQGIRHFWQFLEQNRIALHDVNDDHLRRWLNLQERANVAPQMRAYRCDAVFNLFVWLERRGHVQYMVRIPGENDTAAFTPQLTAVPARAGHNRRRGSRTGLVSVLRPRCSEPPPPPTPTEDQITQLYLAIDDSGESGVYDRNVLLIDWYLKVALRRLEWTAITVDQVPGWDEISTLQERGERYQMLLKTTKGGRSRYVGVLPDLLERTREYIDGARALIVQRFKAKHGGAYREPAQVFLSSKTGKAMTGTAVSNLLRRWFVTAGVPGHGHRLRAAALCRLFDAEIAAEEARMAAYPGSKTHIDFELVLLKVAEQAGHVNLKTLRRYLNDVIKRRARDATKTDVALLELQLRNKEQELAVREARIAQRERKLDNVPQSRKEVA